MAGPVIGEVMITFWSACPGPLLPKLPLLLRPMALASEALGISCRRLSLPDPSREAGLATEDGLLTVGRSGALLRMLVCVIPGAIVEVLPTTSSSL